MKHHLERLIKLCEEKELSRLYRWSLHECDGQGRMIGGEQIPKRWTSYFTASQITYDFSLNISDSTAEQGEDDDEVITPWFATQSVKESIHARLSPGRIRGDQRVDDDVCYSMFGTGRFIAEFDLKILPVKDESHEKAEIWGCVSYTAENADFKDETHNDAFVIYLGLSPSRFHQVAEQIKTHQIDSLEISVGRVSGFYSSWSPGISTHHIKVLTSYHEQKVLTPEECSIVPPRLGDVAEFELTISRSKKVGFSQTEGVSTPGQVHALEKEQLKATDSGQSDCPNCTGALNLEILKRIEESLAPLNMRLLLMLLVLFLLLLKNLI